MNQDSWGQHPNPGSNSAPFVTANKVNVCSTEAVQALPYSYLTTYTAAHASMAMFAWLFISPVCSLVARYLKLELPGPKWFNIHRIGQVRRAQT